MFVWFGLIWPASETPLGSGVTNVAPCEHLCKITHKKTINWSLKKKLCAFLLRTNFDKRHCCLWRRWTARSDRDCWIRSMLASIDFDQPENNTNDQRINYYRYYFQLKKKQQNWITLMSKSRLPLSPISTNAAALTSATTIQSKKKRYINSLFFIYFLQVFDESSTATPSTICLKPLVTVSFDVAINKHANASKNGVNIITILTRLESII